MKSVKGAAAVVLAMGMLLSTTAWAAEKEASSVREAQGGTGIVHVQMTGEAAEQPVAKTVLNESQRQALEKIYQIVPELKELAVNSVSDGGEATWVVFLSDRAGEAVPGIMHTFASLTFKTNTGELINFHFRNPDWASVELPASGLAKEKAAEFARRVLGDKMKDYQMNNQISYGGGGSQDDKGNKITWTSANVQFERLINGIPFLNSDIRVGVDAAGHVTEYYTEGYFQRNDKDSIKDSGLDPAMFPDPALAVTKQAAEEIYAGLLGMKLNYVERQLLWYPTPGKEEVETQPILKYIPTTYAFIDAVTGKPLNESREQQSTSLISLAGEGKKLVARTPEEAAALLAAETGIDISGMKLIREEEMEDHLKSGIKVKEYNWHSEPRTENEDMANYNTMCYLDLRTLADTGQVIGFSLYDESGRGKKAAISKETAQETAIQFVQKYLGQGTVELETCAYSTQETIPDWVDMSKLKDNGLQPEFHFTFTYTHQGIPVSDRLYYVTVNGLIGRITAFHDGNSSSPVTLPDSKNIVTAEAAKAEFLKSLPLRLVYIWPEFFDQKAPKPLLVYMPDYGYGRGYVDALTGKTVTLEMK